MSVSTKGALAGLVLALSALIFGFWGFILVALFMAIGVVVARMTAGEIDVRNVVNAFKGRSTS
ncbi:MULTISPECIES: DUF2273 domain-containing protein [Microbacterium]|uniref:DUF2273 domain-containing protein n=1 Tax=Microbacterium algihabitans TaxID=3075992 RepID=A0ABU3RUN6_9MICO|nr:MULTISPECIES: DUF2273 domain-containing protein [Microbacterium]MCD2168439.1 DUF2273 domain-containing protein [Microbacterium sp. JC 701]MDQ1172352.1 putative membrane protein [Microbacterium testaceum]MDU0326168.1 DUF2273 domain-containing protein [Microbacterium sp. KSW2-21]